MILIQNNREMLIPSNERYIGTTFDTNSETRLFRINRVRAGGIDLANLTFRLDLKYANEAYDTLILDKDVTDDYIYLTWTITETQVEVPGTLFVNIRAIDENATIKWASFIGAFYVEEEIGTPKHYSGDLSELEQLEQSISYVLSNEAERQEAETERQETEAERQEAETEREEAFEEAIADFNRDREELREFSILSKSYAVGDTGERTGEETDNSKYYSEIAANYAAEAKSYADIVVPTFYLDLDTMILYQSGDVERLDFWIDENMNFYYEVS